VVLVGGTRTAFSRLLKGQIREEAIHLLLVRDFSITVMWREKEREREIDIQTESEIEREVLVSMLPICYITHAITSPRSVQDIN
jgi:hypothetical protein